MKKDTRKRARTRIVNPATGRRVLMTGTIGKRIRDTKKSGNKRRRATSRG